MGIEHPDITEAMRAGYPLGYRYDDDKYDDGYYEEDDSVWEED